jgi:hypothetical protein
VAVEPIQLPGLELAERVASVAHELGIETALIGAMAMAVHKYIRGTSDVDLATNVTSTSDLWRLQAKLESLGLKTELRAPDEDDPLGGVLEIWQREDEATPIEPVEIVNFYDPYWPALNPGAAAVRKAVSVEEGSPLRYVCLEDLIALKLYTGSRRDRDDVVELIALNPEADRDAFRAACAPFGFSETLEQLIRDADQVREADR